MGKVVRIDRSNAEEAAEALSHAFLDEAATSYFFPPAEGDKIDKLRALFGWAMEYRMLLDIPALGVYGEDGRLAGAATLRVPNMPADPEPAMELWKEVIERIGQASNARIDEYDAAQSRNLPPGPHHYLVAIGVRPEYQGQGLGGDLLRASISFAERDPASEGIALDTASDKSQALYERFGFSVFAKETLGENVARFMFRAKTAA